ncbi:DNA-formamidopyrimidine glycosylase family protein [Pedobacter sp. ASV12]|uniref:DNA-formamidopyrimidine glycosylase family protein n=1 Tax=Pedobacter sp. ASV12 TaxID=2795120 RepID=UPI0018EBB036|nr:DNA-formamidopyrimidine glycosylase family protein [Pedobacter sp. ASV12]
MPEGPSIVILRELIEDLHLKGKPVLEVGGNTSLDKNRLIGQKVTDFKNWGKHFLICFQELTLRIHLMLFGTYRINERKESKPSISLVFAHNELNFYTCSLQFIAGDLHKVYDWKADVMSDEWDAKNALKKAKEKGETLVCDLLLDQHIFAGVGNIIKNEVLYRIKVHPLSTVSALPLAKLKLLVKEARNYSFDFLAWKKAFVLKKHWLVYKQKKCPKGHALSQEQHLGKTNRRSFYCSQCQKKHI